MKHSSIPFNGIEFINVTSINPLISKCEIKVCYVGDEPNRNGSIITKETAYKLAESLPGSPIVGFYNEEAKDFQEHDVEIEFDDNGELKVNAITFPYGFVDINAKVWFQKFLDDGVNEHEYLMTQGYLWTEQFPECKRVVEQGNNQSMELDDETAQGTWTNLDKNGQRFFIINDAIISKLCILGEDYEPCFEGAQITAPKVQFSFTDGFKEQLSSMMEELKKILNEGGTTKVFTQYQIQIGSTLWDALLNHIDFDKYSLMGTYEEDGQMFAVLKDADEKYFRLNSADENFVDELTELEEYTPEETLQYTAEQIKEYLHEKEFASIKEENGNLHNENANLQAENDRLTKENSELNTQLESLREFKLVTERKEKQAMIDNFYMLSDEDKADVITNIDKYSLDTIEAKLSILYVRNKADFKADEEKDENAFTFTLNANENSDMGSTPAWVQAALAVAKEMN